MKLSYTDGKIKWNFRHLGGNGFLVNNLLIIRMDCSNPENPTLIHLGNPVVTIPEIVVQEFQNEVRKNYPNGLPKDFIS